MSHTHALQSERARIIERIARRQRLLQMTNLGSHERATEEQWLFRDQQSLADVERRIAEATRD